jgi:hypothetical protein
LAVTHRRQQPSTRVNLLRPYGVQAIDFEQLAAARNYFESVTQAETTIEHAASPRT